MTRGLDVVRRSFGDRYSGLPGVYLALGSLDLVLYTLRYPFGALDGVPVKLAVAMHVVRGVMLGLVALAPRLLGRYGPAFFAMIATQLVVMVRYANDLNTSLYLVALIIGSSVIFVSYSSLSDGLIVAAMTGVLVAVAVYSTEGPAVAALLRSLFGALLLSTSPVAVVWFRHNLHDARQKAENLAETDALTGLLNRRGAERLIPAVVESARTAGNEIVVMVTDLDHFKAVNDQHGHAEGDRVLRAAAEAIRANLRTTDLVCRSGGEEFIVVLAADPEAANVLAERIRQAVPAATEPTPVTISIGLAGAAPPGRMGDDVEWTLALIDRADDLMYDAKREGRDRVLVG